MEKILNQILGELKSLNKRVGNLEDDVKGIKKEHGLKLKTLGIDVKGIKEEHGQMLRAILESKEVQRAEMDILTNRTAKIEGTIKGAAKQVLEDLQDVSNR